MAEYYGHTGGGKYAGAPKPAVSWDIGTGTARTTGSAPAIAAPKPVSWDIGAGSARTTGPAPAPAPVYRPPTQSSYSSVPSRAIAPVSNTQMGGTALGGGYGAQAPAPAPPPAPPVGGRSWYNSLGSEGQAQANQQYLAGDSDYNAQIAEYDRALQTFIERIANQKKMFNQDADDAVASTGRNQAMSLDALGEDFGARGLSYSGLYKTENSRTNDRFNEAKGGIEKVRSRNLQDASNRQADYETENKISRGNAERSALSRQAQRQALIDSMAGF